MSGWAVDLNVGSGAGVDTVHVYAYPITDGALGSPTFLGQATYGDARPDVGSAFGAARFSSSGYALTAPGLAAGSYRVIAFARSAITGTFNSSAVADVTVSAPSTNPAMAIDAPVSGSTIGQSATVTGWAVDRGASSGTGVDAIHVYAFPMTSGGLGSPTFLGVATQGGSRPDVGAVFGTQVAHRRLHARGLEPDRRQLSADRLRAQFRDRHLQSGGIRRT